MIRQIIGTFTAAVLVTVVMATISHSNAAAQSSGGVMNPPVAKPNIGGNRSTLAVKPGPTDQYCEVFPGLCGLYVIPPSGGSATSAVGRQIILPDGTECPPECLILKPSTGQTSNAVLRIADTSKATVMIGNTSTSVPSVNSKVILGSVQQVESIAIAKIKSTEPDQTRSSTIQKEISTILDSTRGLPPGSYTVDVTVKCSADSTGKVTCEGSVTIHF